MSIFLLFFAYIEKSWKKYIDKFKNNACNIE